MKTLTWTMDANGGGFTGKTDGWKCYVLKNGGYAVYKNESISMHAEGKALSVPSAKAKCKEIINEGGSL
jgi:hypothetical protein